MFVRTIASLSPRGCAAHLGRPIRANQNNSILAKQFRSVRVANAGKAPRVLIVSRLIDARAREIAQSADPGGVCPNHLWTIQETRIIHRVDTGSLRRNDPMSALHEERQLNAGQRRALIARRCRGAGRYRASLLNQGSRWDACRSRLERAPPRDRESPLDRLTPCVRTVRRIFSRLVMRLKQGLPVQRSTAPNCE